MGLDMDLRKEYYVKNWKHNPPEEQHQITITKGGQPAKIDTSKICYVVVDVAYWRKANAIHRWFVEQCQGGVDECQRSHVAQEQIRDLLELCERVKDNHELASDLLPTQEGFFFGSTDYDESYYQDIDETIKMLEAELNQPDEYYPHYYYKSSW